MMRLFGLMWLTRGGQQVDRDKPVDRRVSAGRSRLVLHLIDQIPKKNMFQLKFLCIAFYDILYLWL